MYWVMRNEGDKVAPRWVRVAEAPDEAAAQAALDALAGRGADPELWQVAEVVETVTPVPAATLPRFVIRG
jgi:hypothetical protein